MSIPPPPRWLVLTGLAGNTICFVAFIVQGSPLAALFATFAIINIYALTKRRGSEPRSPSS